MDDELPNPDEVLYLALDACDAGTMHRLPEPHCPNLGRPARRGSGGRDRSRRTAPSSVPPGSLRHGPRGREAPLLQLGPGRRGRVRPPAHQPTRGPGHAVLGDPLGPTDAASPSSTCPTPTSQLLQRRLAQGVGLPRPAPRRRRRSRPRLLDELDELAGGDHPYGTHAPPAGDDQFAPCDYVDASRAHRTLDEQRQLFDLIARRARGQAARVAPPPRAGRVGPLPRRSSARRTASGHQLWHVHDPQTTLATTRPHGRSSATPWSRSTSRLDAVVGHMLRRPAPTPRATSTCPRHAGALRRRPPPRRGARPDRPARPRRGGRARVDRATPPPGRIARGRDGPRHPMGAVADGPGAGRTHPGTGHPRRPSLVPDPEQHRRGGDPLQPGRTRAAGTVRSERSARLPR